jgi:NRPS condensation-like uncharacterized protein
MIANVQRVLKASLLLNTKHTQFEKKLSAKLLSLLCACYEDDDDELSYKPQLWCCRERGRGS